MGLSYLGKGTRSRVLRGNRFPNGPLHIAKGFEVSDSAFFGYVAVTPFLPPPGSVREADTEFLWVVVSSSAAPALAALVDELNWFRSELEGRAQPFRFDKENCFHVAIAMASFV